MRLEDTTLSIIIPCYNERENIIKILDKIDEVQGFKKEIIVVDDCSNDGTRDILETQVKDRVAKLVYHEKNGGKGAALKTGFSHATGDVVIIQDADLEYDPMEYKDVILPIVQGKAKVVYGSRFKASPSKGYLANRLANKFLTFLSNIFTHQRLTDMETCYKAFRADALKSIPLRSNRFGMEPEITAKVAKRGWTVYEVPISYNGRKYSEGKKIGWKDGVNAICVILKYWFFDDSFYDIDSSSESSQRLEYSQNYLKTLVRRCAPYLGSTTLEIGSGMGNLSKFLPQRERLTLTEADDRRRKYLKASYEGNAVVDVQYLDLISGKTSLQDKDVEAFDSVVCLNRTSSLPLNNTDALVELKRYLKPSGKLLFVASAKSRFSCWLCRRKRSDSTVSFTSKELVKLLKESGYNVDCVKSIASVERLFRSCDPNKAPSFLGFKLFDLLVSRTSWLDRILKPVKYLVVATKVDKK